MPSFTEGVDFDTLAREWRCKWNPDDKGTLQKLQALVESLMPKIKAVKGFKSIQRIICGGCHDFKIIVSVEEPAHGEWEAAAFAPEAEFLAAAKAIEGLKRVETQTYTIMPL